MANIIPVKNGEEKDASFLEVTELFYKLQRYKARRYGDSWCKHGEAVSVFGNTSRKYDRIENMVIAKVEAGFEYPDPDSEESLAETVGDLGIYSVLWMTYIKKNRPKEYEAWKRRIQTAHDNTEQDPYRETLMRQIEEFARALAIRFCMSREELKKCFQEALATNVI